MEQSQQVLEWQAEAEARGKQAFRRALRGLLERRFGALSETLHARINTTEDLGRLETAIYQTLNIQSLDELQL